MTMHQMECQPQLSQKKGLGSCGQCIKYLMCAMNLIFLLLAIAILGLGIYFLVDKSFLSTTYDMVLPTVAACLMIVGGGVLIFITFLGCMGALRENKWMLILYLLPLVIIFILCLTGVILSFVFRRQIGEHVRVEMRETLKNNYGVNLENDYNQAITDAWNKMQSKLSCCSIEDQSWSTYRTSEWYKIQPGIPNHDKPFVPESCCTKDEHGEYIELQKCQTTYQGPPGRLTGPYNEAVFYEGCYEKGKQFLKEASGFIIGFGIAMAICMICGIVFSVVLIIQL